MLILIKNAHVVDPKNDLRDVLDILIKNETISEIKQGIVADGAQIVDAKGLTVVPGLLDMHVHLREPGREDAETIASGCLAAAHGGFTGVACMPNTIPAIDSAEVVESILAKAKGAACRVFPIGTISKGRLGKELAPLGELAASGAYGFTDDGSPVMDTGLMRRAMEYSKQFDKPLMPHEEDKSLSDGGVMNEGTASTRLGLPGIHRASEEHLIARDIQLVEYFGGRLHITHVSTAGGVDLIRYAKQRNVSVTAETCPHYWTLFDKDIHYNTNFKMYPPLRTLEDGQAIIAGLKDGTLDAIATDHAPHTEADKDVEFNVAAFGIIGLETSLGLVLTTLLHPGILTLHEIIEKMSYAPCRILGVPHEGIRAKASAHLTMIDLNQEWTVNKEDIVSKSKNTPFIGWKLKGKAVGTMVDGRWTYLLNDK